jgi:hypothetical protein
VALNTEWVLFNLKEAKEELERAIREIEGDPDYSSAEFGIVLTEVYEHVNMAWNSREVSDAEARECTTANYCRWRRMPTDVLYDYEG